MYLSEPSPSKKKGGFLRKISLVALLAGLLLPLYWYAPRWYHEFSGNTILRVQQRSQKFEDLLHSKEHSLQSKYEFLEETRIILRRLLKNNPAEGQVYYYLGLFHFYELVLRLPLDATSLLRLAGRGFLPEDSGVEELPKLSLPALGRAEAILMRKALALEPDAIDLARARLAIAYGDFLFTGRTDLNLADLLEAEQSEALPAALQPARLWLQFSINTILGRSAELSRLSKEFGLLNPPAILVIEPGQLDLLQCYAAFYSDEHPRALQLARQIKTGATDLYLKVEAARIEAEILLIQNRKELARNALEQALQWSDGADETIVKRLLELD